MGYSTGVQARQQWTFCCCSVGAAHNSVPDVRRRVAVLGGCRLPCRRGWTRSWATPPTASPKPPSSTSCGAPAGGCGSMLSRYSRIRCRRRRAADSADAVPARPASPPPHPSPALLLQLPHRGGGGDGLPLRQAAAQRHGVHKGRPSEHGRRAQPVFLEGLPVRGARGAEGGGGGTVQRQPPAATCAVPACCSAWLQRGAAGELL